MNRLRPLTWLVLVMLTTASCSTMINVRSEDYGRIEPLNTYRIVTADGHEYEATNLVVKEDAATFTQNGVNMTVPIRQITLIQQINTNEVLTGVMVLGIAAAVVGGIFLVFSQD